MQNGHLQSAAIKWRDGYKESGNQENRVSINQHLFEFIDFGSRASLSQRTWILLLLLERIVHS